MKRKIFSKLLMVALVIAAVGSFVSCKDYDDDINNLQKQIDNAALKSDLAALQTTLTSVQSTASKAATDATSALSKAGANADDIAALKTKANELGTQIATAAQTATKGVEDAAKAAQAAKDAADAAKEAKDAIAPAIQAALEEATTKFNAAIGAKADTATVKALATKLAEAESTLGTVAPLVAANAEAIDALEEQAADFEARIKALEAKTSGEGAAEAMAWAKAITSIELVPSWSLNQGVNNMGALQTLNFRYGHVSKNAKFGDNEGYKEADKIIEYAEGDSIKVQNFVLVRVNPANAVLAKENIQLINSKGEALDDYVDVLDPIKYEGLLTRATTVESGLYMIPFQLKTKDVDVDELKDAVAEYNTDGTVKSRVLFAVAVNNTKDAAQRYVNTTFDLMAAAGKYNPGTTFDFAVNDLKASDNKLKNRWNGKIISEKGQQSTKPENAELAWGKDASNKTVLPVYESDMVKKADDDSNKATYNVKVDGADKRYNVEALVVDLNKAFTVEMVDPTQIDYYYVLFDKQSAIESAPSEWNAWSEYTVEGLGVMKQANEELELTIKSEKALGDYIGFRVYAVNYDGTLADPDGRAFYVKVGDITRGEVTVSGSWTASVKTATVGATKAALTADNVISLENNTGTIAIDGSKFESLKLAEASGTVKIDATKYANGVRTAATDRTLYYVLLGSDGKAAKNWKDITAIKVGLKTAGDWVDYEAASANNGQTEYGKIGFEIKGFDPDDDTELINTLNVTVTKSLITTGTEPTYMPTYGPVGGVLTLWMRPQIANDFANADNEINARPTAVAYTADAKKAAFAKFGEANMATYVKNANKYIYEFVAAGEAKYTAAAGRYANGSVANVEVDGATSTVLALAGPIANNTTSKVTYTKAASNVASAIDGTSKEPAQKLEIAANSKYSSKIGDGVEYTLNIYEDSEVISLDRPADEATAIGLLAQSLKATFAHDVLDTYQTYSLKEYMYTTALKSDDQSKNDWTKGIQKSKEYYIKYSDIVGGHIKFYPVHNHANGVAPASTEEAAATVAGNLNINNAVLAANLNSGASFADFAALLTGNNSVWTGAYTTLSADNYATNGTKGLGYGLDARNYTFYASFTSNVTEEEDYVQVRINSAADNKFIYRKTPVGIGGASGQAPTGNVPSHLTIKATDAFGNAVTILDEAIIVKP